MLRWAIVFLVFALVAALFGFTTIAGEAAFFARVLFFVFLVLFLLGAVFGYRRGPADLP
jgi:uncharacterized membrane protein YtjA (UPF0391 family)